MVETALISIILPVFNGEKYLRSAIESCVTQTYKNIELIIVDDGSTDNTLNIAEELAAMDQRIHIISNSVNKNLPASLNIGHYEAKGEYITWTSHDNIYQKDAIQTMHAFLNQSQADVVYADYLLINEEGNLKGKTILKPIEFLLFQNVIGACFLYKREVFLRNEGYSEDLFLVEDYDFWIRALKHSVFVKIDNPGYYFYRYHLNSLTEKMNGDKELKNQFLQNLHILYKNFFSNLNLENKNFCINYLIERFLNNPKTILEVVENTEFFKDLEKISNSIQSVPYRKVKSIVFDDLVDAILHNPKKQSISAFYLLHRIGIKDLMGLPINRYFALLKKCVFNNGF